MYMVEFGFDAIEDDLVAIAPQPKSEGMRFTRTTYAADGSVYREGAYIDLVWDLLQDASDYQALLAQFDLVNNLTREVTVKVRNEFFTPQIFNGIAVRPESTSWQYFPRNIVILIKNLEPIPEAP